MKIDMYLSKSMNMLRNILHNLFFRILYVKLFKNNNQRKPNIVLLGTVSHVYPDPQCQGKI